MTEPAIAVEQLGVRFGGVLSGWLSRTPPVEALVDVTLDCVAGEVVGVLGPNGSGKTTLLEVLAGSTRPSRGRARVLGLDPTHRELTRRVGFQPDGPLPFPHFRVAEFLAYFAALAGLDRTRARVRADRWLERFELDSLRRRRVATLSTGMRRRLALAAALLPDVEVLLLDEPTAGLDPIGSRLVVDLLAELAAGGCAILLASHDLQEVEQSCDRVWVLASGRVAARGSLDELLATDEHLLAVRRAGDAARERIEHAARDAGCEVVGWRTGRRHLFDLFRRVDDAAHGERRSDPR